MNRWRLAYFGLATITVAGCAGTPTPPPSPSPVGRADCDPPSFIHRGSGISEVYGTGDGMQVWGFVMAAGSVDPLHTNEQVKIVWRITGSGPLHLSSVAPAGQAHGLQWGPEPHGGSTYERPGQEWGAGYLFAEAGCWTLRVTRGAATADIWLDVVP